MTAQKIGKIRFQPGAPYKTGMDNNVPLFIHAMCPIDVVARPRASSAGPIPFRRGDAAPRLYRAAPRIQFGKMICDALNLAMANPDFVQAYSHYLYIVLDETNGPIGASVVWKTLCRPPNASHRYFIPFALGKIQLNKLTLRAMRNGVLPGQKLPMREGSEPGQNEFQIVHKRILEYFRQFTTKPRQKITGHFSAELLSIGDWPLRLRSFPAWRYRQNR
jgi:hypothetical protein